MTGFEPSDRLSPAPNTTPKGWTDADVEMVAAAEFAADQDPENLFTWEQALDFVRKAYRDRARAGLAALAGAGRLRTEPDAEALAYGRRRARILGIQFNQDVWGAAYTFGAVDRERDLTKAGRLLPEDTRTIVEDEIQWRDRVGEVHDLSYLDYDDTAMAVELAAGRGLGSEPVRRRRRTMREFADGSSWVGPWVPVPEPAEPPCGLPHGLCGDDEDCRLPPCAAGLPAVPEEPAAYFCPTSGQNEDPVHGGFDVCCDRPELHRSAVPEEKR